MRIPNRHNIFCGFAILLVGTACVVVLMGIMHLAIWGYGQWAWAGRTAWFLAFPIVISLFGVVGLTLYFALICEEDDKEKR
jgi:phosphotransferase system  glucose/maltose/N-acetylglucosamine-specific IIC component